MSTNHASGQSNAGFVRREALPLVDRLVEHHARSGAAKDDPSLITVTHTPNALASHLVASQTEAAPTVRMENGVVVTRHEDPEYGTLLAVLGGPAVVEIGLHNTPEQRDAYRLAVRSVDAEAAQHAAMAIQQAALAIVQSLGVVVEDGETQDGLEDEEPS